jgi:D-sedoheptulose 7-phosphate isomerase
VAAAAFADAARLLDIAASDRSLLDAVDEVAALIAGAIRAGGKVLICGNGGSLADATHFAEELTGRFRKDRPALPAIAIAEPGHLTCTANDFGYDRVFSRGVEALGKTGDVLIVLSTSGNSANIVEAVKTARTKGLRTVALTGKGGGALKGSCDQELLVPGQTADRIQELHMLILHTLVEGIERAMGYA